MEDLCKKVCVCPPFLKILDPPLAKATTVRFYLQSESSVAVVLHAGCLGSYSQATILQYYLWL